MNNARMCDNRARRYKDIDNKSWVMISMAVGMRLGMSNMMNVWVKWWLSVDGIVQGT